MTEYEMRKIAKYQAEYLIKALKEDDELLDTVFPPKMMGIQEAADYLCIPLNTLYQKAGEIPHQKVGKRLLFTDRGLSRWVRRKNIENSPALRKAE